MRERVVVVVVVVLVMAVVRKTHTVQQARTLPQYEERIDSEYTTDNGCVGELLKHFTSACLVCCVDHTNIHM